MDKIKDLRQCGIGSQILRFAQDDRSLFGMTDGEVLARIRWYAITKNCILVVYLLAFDDVTCYTARSFKILAPNPSGAAISLRAYNAQVTYALRQIG